MAIEWMKELTSKLLKAIALKIQKKDGTQWFEIFLTMFVLLNNLEYVYGTQQAFRAYLGRTVCAQKLCILRYVLMILTDNIRFARSANVGAIYGQVDMVFR